MMIKLREFREQSLKYDGLAHGAQDELARVSYGEIARAYREMMDIAMQRLQLDADSICRASSDYLN